MPLHESAAEESLDPPYGRGNGRAGNEPGCNLEYVDRPGDEHGLKDGDKTLFISFINT